MGAYRILFDSVLSKMQTMSEGEATQFAFNIAESINYFLLHHKPLINEDVTIKHLIPYSVRSHAVMNVGWEALHCYKHGSDREVIEIDFLSTLPTTYRLSSQAHQLRNETGIWAGSLLLSIAEIINGSLYDLFIIAPYWSVTAINALLSNLDKTKKPQLVVSILTQPETNLKPDELQAIEILRAYFLSLDAKLTISSPKFENNQYPLLHAKTVIGDGKDAYIGSANYTASGIEHSIEIGTRIKGIGVSSLVVWARFLKSEFDHWKF